MRELADWLTDLGVRSYRGGRWTAAGLSNLLQNPAYLGRVEFGKSSKSKYRQRNPGGKRIAKDKKDWTIIADAHDALIDQDLFDAVGEKLTRNRGNTGPRKVNGSFALKGMVKCNRCGAPMHGYVEKGVRKYLCGKYKQSAGACERLVVNEKELLREVLKQIREKWLDPLGDIGREQIRSAMRDILKEDDQTESVMKGQLQKIETELKRLDRRLADVSADMIPRIEKRLRAAEDDHAALLDRMKAKQAQPQTVELIESRIAAAIQWLDNLESLVESDYDARELNEALRTLVTEIRCEIDRRPVCEGAKKHTCELTGGMIHIRPSGLGLPFGDLLNHPKATWDKSPHE